jgi:hypothetical protein
MQTTLRDRSRGYQSDTVRDHTVPIAARGSGHDLRRYFACEVTRDCGVVAIRAIRPDDSGRLGEHFGSLSPTSAYFRFFSPKRKVSERERTGITDIGFRCNVTLVATVCNRGAEHLVGLGQYVVDDGCLQRATGLLSDRRLSGSRHWCSPYKARRWHRAGARRGRVRRGRARRQSQNAAAPHKEWAFHTPGNTGRHGSRHVLRGRGGPVSRRSLSSR